MNLPCAEHLLSISGADVFPERRSLVDRYMQDFMYFLLRFKATSCITQRNAIDIRGAHNQSTWWLELANFEICGTCHQLIYISL